MKVSSYTRRFLNSTRGQITVLLREKPRTVAELAEKLSLTDNAVRAHLATLERDGLVQQSGERPGLRKPHLSYELTAEAEEIFPKAYGIVLDGLLGVLKTRLGPDKVENVLRELGHNLAALQSPVAGLPFPARLEKALQVIASIGGQAHLEQEDGGIAICGRGCPLSSVTTNHEEVCGMLETVLSDIIGTPVQQVCRRAPVAQCHFQVPVPLSARAELA